MFRSPIREEVQIIAEGRRRGAPRGWLEQILYDTWFLDFNRLQDVADTGEGQEWISVNVGVPVAPALNIEYEVQQSNGSFCRLFPGTGLNTGIQYENWGASLPAAASISFEFGSYLRFRLAQISSCFSFLGFVTGGSGNTVLSTAGAFNTATVGFGFHIDNTGALTFKAANGSAQASLATGKTIAVNEIVEVELRGRMSLSNAQAGSVTVEVWVGNSLINEFTIQAVVGANLNGTLSMATFMLSPTMTVVRTSAAGSPALFVDAFGRWFERRR